MTHFPLTPLLGHRRHPFDPDDALRAAQRLADGCPLCGHAHGQATAQPAPEARRYREADGLERFRSD